MESFRSSLIIYVSKARPAVEDVSAEVTRVRLWLQNDRRLYWEAQVRTRTKALEKAKQDLFSSGLARKGAVGSAEQLQVSRARRALEEAEERLRLVKHWSRDFDSQVEPLARQLDPLVNVLAHDMPKAAAALAQTIKVLDAYAEVAPPAFAPETVPATAAPEAGEATATEGNQPDSPAAAKSGPEEDHPNPPCT